MDEPQATLDEDATVDEYVEFVRAGTRATGAFECAACGDQIIARGPLLPCVKCGGGLWERSTWSPFGLRPRSELTRV